MFVLLSALLAVDAMPVKPLFSIQEDVHFVYPYRISINTPIMYYYYVPYFIPPSSPSINQLTDPALEFDEPEGVTEYKQFLSDRTILGLFTASDLDSVEVYSNPFQEFINRVFFGGQYRPNRLWALITGNRPAGATSVSSAITNQIRVSSGSTVDDNENESVIIEVQ
jgi:hypothetical protein